MVLKDGNVINVFNGEVNGTDRNSPFFEMDSLSGAKELEVGQSNYHWQNIYHFEGTGDKLNAIARKTLGVRLDEIEF